MRHLIRGVLWSVGGLAVLLVLIYGGICLYWTVQFEKLRTKTIEKGYPQTPEELIARYGNPLRTPDPMLEEFIRADIGDSIFDDNEFKHTDIIAPDSYWTEISANLAEHRIWVEWMDNLPDTWLMPWRIDWNFTPERFRINAFWNLYHLRSRVLIHERKQHLFKRMQFLLKQRESFLHDPSVLSFIIAKAFESAGFRETQDILNIAPITDTDIRECLIFFNQLSPYREFEFYISSDWLNILAYTDKNPQYDLIECSFWEKCLPRRIFNKREMLIQEELIFNQTLKASFDRNLNASLNLLRAGLGVELYFRENGKYPPSLEVLVPAYIPRLLENPRLDSPLLFEHGNHLEITVRNFIYDTNDKEWVPDYSTSQKGFYQGFRVWWGDEIKGPYDEFRRVSGKVYFENEVQTDSGF